MNDIDVLFEETKKGIHDILKLGMLEKVKKYVYGEHEYKFDQETITESLPNVQAINAGILKQVKVYDVDGNEHFLSAEEYVERNLTGFKNELEHKVDLDILLEVLDKIETFTALVNFGSFEMAKNFYLKHINEIKGVDEEGE